MSWFDKIFRHKKKSSFVRAIPLSKVNVVIFFIVVMLLGFLFILIPNIQLITFGFFLFILGVHELSHLFILYGKGYGVKGIAISIWPPGIGPIPDREIEVKDAAQVYLSGLFSLIVPILLIILYPELFMFLLIITIITISFSIIDYKDMRDIQKRHKSNII